MTDKIEIVNDKWEIHQKLGAGAFGDVYLGCDKETKYEVACKFEDLKTKHPQLEHEERVYKNLSDGLGIPKVHFIGPTGDYQAMVMDLLGPSLE